LANLGKHWQTLANLELESISTGGFKLPFLVAKREWKSVDFPEDEDDYRQLSFV
jgi:hypothetical protein